MYFFHFKWSINKVFFHSELRIEKKTEITIISWDSILKQKTILSLESFVLRIEFSKKIFQLKC